MNFQTSYKVLSQNNFVSGEYSLIPLRYQDRNLIMRWRNEQMYHLRQKSPLTQIDQECYFNEVVSKLFGQEQPDQILFSYLEYNQLVGYGGLVHIDWELQKAEVSFIMNTRLEASYFNKHWSTYLGLIEEVAFADLNLRTIFTYAYDLRPKIYEVLEENGYKLASRLRNEVKIDGEMKDVLIHEKNNPLSIRLAVESDLSVLFEWTNDPLTRGQSFDNEEIDIETHISWFHGKLTSNKSTIYIAEYKHAPCGVVRFEEEDALSVIAISLSPEFRGKRLATRILLLAVGEYQRKCSKAIHALIKCTNLVSIKSFQRAGFFFNKELEVQGHPSVLYICE